MTPYKTPIFALAVIVLSTGAAMSADENLLPVKHCLVTELGAVGDGRTLNTKAIQATIDKCAADGGGVAVVPKGTFLTGAIFLKQGVDLQIDKGGALKGTADQKDYPIVKTRWEGEELERTAALVNAVDLSCVEVTGEGVIDGSGDQWVDNYNKEHAPQRKGGITPPIPGYGRPKLICFQNCKKIHIAGLSLKNQASWGLHILYTDGAVVENLTIRARHDIPSSDGIDVDSSRNVRITKCDIDVNDDCISIKAGKNEDGRRVNRPSEDIAIENCRFGYKAGVAMGSEVTGGIRNVEVRDCVFEDGNLSPVRFKSQPSRGGVVENITYRNIELRDTQRAFDFNLEWRMVPPVAPPAKTLTVVRNVRLINITGTTKSAGVMHGMKDSPIRDVKFEKCKISAETGLVVDNLIDADFSGLDLTVKEGRAIIWKGGKPESAKSP